MAKSKTSAKTKSKIKVKPKAKLSAKKKSTPKKAAKAKTPAKKAAVKPAAKTPKKKAATKAAARPALKPSVRASEKTSAAPSMKRFMPLDDRILVRRLVAETKTAGGLFIPDSAQEKPTTGRVIAVGRGHRDAKGRTRPCDVQVGDTVLFSAWAGSEIDVDGEKFTVLRETDLLGVSTN